MIVDVHYHLMPFNFTVENTKGMLFDPIWAAKKIGMDFTEEEFARKAAEVYSGLEPKKIINRMDEAGIDITLICHVDNASSPFFKAESTMKVNKAISDIAKEYPNRLIPLAGVDPRRPEALDMLKQCFEFGMKGLKFHPDSGYSPDHNPEVLKYLEKMNGILLTHTGPLNRVRSKFSEVGLLSDVLVDYPNLKIIAAHMGQINWRPWASLATYNSNLYGDLAMWPFLFGKFENFCRELRNVIDYAGAESIVFGSDAPIFEMVMPIKKMIGQITDLPNSAPNGIKFTKEEISSILGDNAAAMLGLD